MRQINSYLDVYRSPREQLIELYLETKNKNVLEHLIKKCGELVLLELDWEGYKILSQMIFSQGAYNLFSLIENPKHLRKFCDYIIDKFIENEESEDEYNFSDRVVSFIERFDFNSNVTSKAIIRERYSLLLRILIHKKNSTGKILNLITDVQEAIVKNHSIPLEVILELIKEFPGIALNLMENLQYKAKIRASLDNIISILARIEDTLKNVTEEVIDVDEMMKKGIDLFLDNMDIEELYFPLFCSVRFIPTNLIEFRKDLFILFFQRFTLIFKGIKDAVNHVVENEKEREGIFPLGIINNEIMMETPEGLAYALFHGETLKAYVLVQYDRFLMETIKLVKECFDKYVHMGILPENWLYSDDYYNNLMQLEGDKRIETVTTEFDISELLEDFN